MRKCVRDEAPHLPSNCCISESECRIVQIVVRRIVQIVARQIGTVSLYYRLLSAILVAIVIYPESTGWNVSVEPLIDHSFFVIRNVPTRLTKNVPKYNYKPNGWFVRPAVFCLRWCLRCFNTRREAKLRTYEEDNAQDAFSCFKINAA